MKKYIFIGIGLAALFQVRAQDRSHFYTNLLNPFLTNPAVASMEKGIQTTFNARTVLGGIDGLPRTINAGVYGQMAQDAGLGLKVISDWRGVFQLTNAEGAYSKRVWFNTSNQLSFGLSLGISQTSIRSEMLNGNVRLEDPLLTDKNLNRLRISSGAGLVYRYADKFEFSTSFPMLITGDQPINGFFVSSASYTFKNGASKEYALIPQVNYYNFIYSNKMADLILNGSWKETFSIAAGYRSNGSYIVGAGILFSGFSARYMYYGQTGVLTNLAPAQNEIALGIKFNKPKAKPVQHVVGSDAFSVELNKINKRIIGLMQIESTNPGLVDVPAELVKIRTELESILKQYTIDQPEQIKQLRNVQESLDLMIQKYK